MAKKTLFRKKRVNKKNKTRKNTKRQNKKREVGGWVSFTGCANVKDPTQRKYCQDYSPHGVVTGTVQGVTSAVNYLNPYATKEPVKQYSYVSSSNSNNPQSINSAYSCPIGNSGNACRAQAAALENRRKMNTMYR
jgi:hypothetical protein